MSLEPLELVDTLLEDLESKIPMLLATGLDEPTIRKIAEFDPTPSKDYINWLIRMHRNGSWSVNDSSIKEVLKKYASLSTGRFKKLWKSPLIGGKVNINDYPTYAALKADIEKADDRSFESAGMEGTVVVAKHGSMTLKWLKTTQASMCAAIGSRPIPSESVAKTFTFGDDPSHTYRDADWCSGTWSHASEYADDGLMFVVSSSDNEPIAQLFLSRGGLKSPQCHDKKNHPIESDIASVIAPLFASRNFQSLLAANPDVNNFGLSGPAEGDPNLPRRIAALEQRLRQLPARTPQVVKSKFESLMYRKRVDYQRLAEAHINRYWASKGINKKFTSADQPEADRLWERTATKMQPEFVAALRTAIEIENGDESNFPAFLEGKLSKARADLAKQGLPDDIDEEDFATKTKTSIATSLENCSREEDNPAYVAVQSRLNALRPRRQADSGIGALVTAVKSISAAPESGAEPRENEPFVNPDEDVLRMETPKLSVPEFISDPAQFLEIAMRAPYK